MLVKSDVGQYLQFLRYFDSDPPFLSSFCSKKEEKVNKVGELKGVDYWSELVTYSQVD